MMRLVVEIEVGNEAMSTHEDVAVALLQTATKLRQFADPPELGAIGRVLDRNGNAVGSYGFRRGR